MANEPPVPAIAGSSNPRKPPPLNMPYASGSNSYTPRRHSSDNEGSNSEDDDHETSPLSALDSSAALILVHDDDDDDDAGSPFDLTDDEDDNDLEDPLVSPMFAGRKSAAFPALRPTTVFLYLLSPYLKLGALSLPTSGLPLKYGLPMLLLTGLAAAFARQIWYMLARYLRKADMTEVFLDTFAKGRGRERQRALIRFLSRTGTGALSTLLAITYLRHSMYTLHSIAGNERHPVLSYVLSTMGVGALVAYFSYARSLNSTRALYITWISIATFIAWWGCTIYAHVHGLLDEGRQGWLGSDSIWQGLATIAFAFGSSSTLPLYSSLKSGTTRELATGKSPRSHSFRILSFFSVATAVLLILPSIIFAAFPNNSATFGHQLQQSQVNTPSNSTTSTLLLSTPPSGAPMTLNGTNVPVLASVPALSLPLPAEVALPSIQIEAARRALASVTVLLGVPPLIITTPPIAVSALRSVKFNVSRVLTILVILVVALIPPHTYPPRPDADASPPPMASFFTSSKISAIIAGAALLMTLLGTYFLPAFLHIAVHWFKRPLAIVVPPTPTPLVHTPTASMDASANANAPAGGDGDGDGADGGLRQSPRSMYDDLLLRKERALQKKQFKKRIVWDIGVWVLAGASVAAVVVLIGGFAGAW